MELIRTRHHRRGRAVRAVAGMLLLSQAACMTTRVLTSHQLSEMPAGTTKAVVNTADGSIMKLLLPRVKNDSVYGTTAYGEMTAIPFSDVRTLTVNRFSGKRAALIGAFMFAAGGLLALNAGHGTGAIPPNIGVDCNKKMDVCERDPGTGDR